MSTPRTKRWMALVGLNAIAIAVLGWHQPSGAEPRESSPPFANAEEQRGEIINELKQLNALMKEQNSLLRSGKLRVIVADAKAR